MKQELEIVSFNLLLFKTQKIFIGHLHICQYFCYLLEVFRVYHISIFSARGLNSAEQIVRFCEEQPMFRQSRQDRYLAATTTRRSYYHLTGELVDSFAPKELIAARAVKPLEGS